MKMSKMKLKWIKLTTDMFDNPKIKYIRNLPDGDRVLLVWVAILTMAGRCNSNGMLILADTIPYTAKMIADEYRFDVAVVEYAVNVFLKMNMLQCDDGTLEIPGWSEYQSIDKISQVQEQNRIRQQRHREKMKALAQKEDSDEKNNVIVTLPERYSSISISNSYSNSNSISDSNNNNIISNTDINNKNNISNKYRWVIDAWNSLSQYGLTPIKSIPASGNRRILLEARLREYGDESFGTCIENIRDSDFLLGKHGGKPWQISFDWLIKPCNYIKVYEGNYSNKRPNKEPEMKSEDTSRFRNCPDDLVKALQQKGAILEDESLDYSLITDSELNELRKYGAC